MPHKINRPPEKRPSKRKKKEKRHTPLDNTLGPCLKNPLSILYGNNGGQGQDAIWG